MGEGVHGQRGHQGGLGWYADKPRLETEGSDVPREGCVLLEPVSEALERLVATPEDMELGEQVLLADVQPAAAHQCARREGVMVVALEMFENLVEQLCGEIVYGGRLVVRSMSRESDSASSQ